MEHVLERDEADRDPASTTHAPSAGRPCRVIGSGSAARTRTAAVSATSSTPARTRRSTSPRDSRQEASWQPQWGALTFTVPAGWANSADWPNSFVLTPSDAYATEGPSGQPDGSAREVASYRLPYAIGQDAACTDQAVQGVTASVDGLIAYVRGLKSVVATAPAAMTIDGHPAKWIDVTIAPSWTKTCPDEPNGSAHCSLARDPATRPEISTASGSAAPRSCGWSSSMSADRSPWSSSTRAIRPASTTSRLERCRSSESFKFQ